DGVPGRIAGVCFDITKLQEDNEQILELNKKLMLSNRELERFAYVASHDLQEPLRMVSSYTQMLELRYGDKLDANAREYINFAVDGAHRMYNLINGLLAYSRIQRRGSSYKMIDLNKTVEDVKKLLEIQISEKKAVIKADTLPQIRADESQIIQLLQNLFSNALKFSIGVPKVYVTSKIEKDRYVISIRDEGIGIESQYFEKIFVIFQKLHSNDEYEGTGLGLAICKSIVEKHGGIIWVDSKPGEGSTFSFTIPLIRSQLPPAHAVIQDPLRT
ncbi:MAG: ATP-binding protein, partial [Bacteroidales bacterium]